MTRRLAIYSTALLALTAAWGYFVLTPHFAAVRAASALAEENGRQLEEIRELALHLPESIEVREPSVEPVIDRDSARRAGTNLLPLLADIRQCAADHRIELLEITPPIEELLRLNDLDRRGGEPPYLNIEVTLAGAFVPLGKFVETIEQRDYTRGINRCLIASERDGTGPLTMQLGFRALLKSRGDT